MQDRKFKRNIGLALTLLGVIILLFACYAFMSSNETLMGLDVSGIKKLAPTLLGLIFLAAGVSIINKN